MIDYKVVFLNCPFSFCLFQISFPGRNTLRLIQTKLKPNFQTNFNKSISSKFRKKLTTDSKYLSSLRRSFFFFNCIHQDMALLQEITKATNCFQQFQYPWT